MTSVSVIQWANKFHTDGIDGLRQGGRGHRPRKLSGKNVETVRDWVLSSKDSTGKRVHWTLKRLCIEIKECFNIEIASSTLSDALAKMKLVIKRPRPMHYRYDSQKADEFKKKHRK